MKSRKPLLSVLTLGVLMFAGNLLAQDTPPPPPPPPAPTAPAAAPMAPAPDAAAPGNAAPSTAVLQTAQGQVVVNSAPAPAPTIPPAPSFEQLSGGSKAITADQAVAYPPLANDFINADSNRNGTVSKAEYERWTKQL
jgi:hypothetical protein